MTLELLIVGAGPLGLAARDEVQLFGLDAAVIATDALVMVEADGAVLAFAGERLEISHPAHILLAAEPVPRIVPIPGWSLQGVSALADAAPQPGDVVWIAAPRALLAEAAALHPAAQCLAFEDVTDLRAEGTERLVAIGFSRDGVAHRAAADRLVLHDGVMPAVQQTRALGCAHGWEERQRCWYPVTDAYGATSRAGVFAACVSAASARQAVRGVARALGRSAAAGAMETLADAPPPVQLVPADTTILCPCEGVTAGAVRAAGRLGCPGLNQLKVFTRCGMGPCQGRLCGALAAEVLAAARGVPAAEIAPMRVRFPLVPVTLGALAALAEGLG